MKRGRKPPIHTPLVCTTCGEPPKMRDGALLACECGAAWSLDVLDAARRPEWIKLLKGN